jgi:3-dehydroquinate synthetase
VPRLAGLLAALGLPTAIPASLEPAAILEVARRDKKARGGRIACALPVRLGAMAQVAGSYRIPVDDALIEGVLRAGPRAPRRIRAVRRGGTVRPRRRRWSRPAAGR